MPHLFSVLRCLSESDSRSCRRHRRTERNYFKIGSKSARLSDNHCVISFTISSTPISGFQPVRAVTFELSVTYKRISAGRFSLIFVIGIVLPVTRWQMSVNYCSETLTSTPPPAFRISPFTFSKLCICQSTKRQRSATCRISRVCLPSPP